MSKTEVVPHSTRVASDRADQEAQAPRRLPRNPRGAAIPACSRRRNMRSRGVSAWRRRGAVLQHCESRGMPTHDVCGQL